MFQSNTQPLKAYLYKFDIPQSKRLQYEKIIRTQDNESLQHLAKTSLSRNELIIVVEKSSSSAIIHACEKYIPDLYGVILSVEGNGSLRLNEQLCFTWSSFVSPKDFKTGYSLRFELIMTLMVYGLAHFNRASEVNDSNDEANFDENVKLVVNHLKIASGVFEFINRVELPRWTNPPDDLNIECISNISLALSLLSISLGNSVAVIKAIKQGASHSLISKVSCEAWHKAEMVKQLILDDLGDHQYKKLSKSFKNYLKTVTSLQHIITMREMGRNSVSEKHFGIAITYFSISINLISKLKKPSDQRELAILNSLLHEIQTENQALVRENEVIYFEKKVDVKTLVQPDPKGLVSLINYEPPMPSFSRIF